MRQAARVTAPTPLRHMYSRVRFPRVDVLPQHHARVEATEAEAVLKHVIDLRRFLLVGSDPCHFMTNASSTLANAGFRFP
jgi:hypothetical protein